MHTGGRVLAVPLATVALMALGLSHASADPPPPHQACFFSKGLTTCVEESSDTYTTAHITTGESLPPDDSIPAWFCRLQHPELTLISYDADASFAVVETTITTTVDKGRKARKQVSSAAETRFVEITALAGRASCAFI